MASVSPDVEKLIAEWAPRLRQAFLQAIATLGDRVPLGDVEAALRRGDVDGAVRAVGLDPAAFDGLAAQVAAAYAAGGSATTANLPAVRDEAGARLMVLFSARNPQAEAYLRTHAAALVTEIIDDQRQAIRQHLTAGMEAGQGPRAVALELVGRVNPTTRKRVGGVLGLTSAQEEWSKNYRAELEGLRPSALKRQLRDSRFDGAVRRAISTGQPLSPDQIAKMVTAYRSRALLSRAQNIARTEAMTALNKSEFDAVAQAIEKGHTDERYVEKEWLSAEDTRVRHTHSVLNKTKVGFREHFVSESGARLLHPGDPSAPVEEIAGCRCHYRIRIDFLGQAAARARAKMRAA